MGGGRGCMFETEREKQTSILQDVPDSIKINFRNDARIDGAREFHSELSPWMDRHGVTVTIRCSWSPCSL
jgi:hypothetical protein